VPENSGADGAFCPFFLSDELKQTDLMVLVRASQHQDIIIILLCQLLFDIFDLELFKTDHTFFILHLALGKLELYTGEIGYFKDIVILFTLEVVLLVDHVDHQGHDLEVLIFLVEDVLVIEEDLQLIVGGHVDAKVSLLFALEGSFLAFRHCLHLIKILTISGRTHVIRI
jgi:hypothetical protein